MHSKEVINAENNRHQPLYQLDFKVYTNEIFCDNGGEKMTETDVPNKPKIIVIPAKNRDEIRRKTHLKVAAYCHVSTDKEEQESSYKAHISCYTEKMKNSSECLFVVSVPFYYRTERGVLQAAVWRRQQIGSFRCFQD